MLQLNYIRENRDTVIERLAVKHFKEIGLVDEIISLDEERRKIQSESEKINIWKWIDDPFVRPPVKGKNGQLNIFTE